MSDTDFDDLQWKEHQIAEALFDQAFRGENWPDAKIAFERLSAFVDQLERTFSLLCEMYGKKHPAPTSSDVASVERIATLAIQLAQDVITKFGRE